MANYYCYSYFIWNVATNVKLSGTEAERAVQFLNAFVALILFKGNYIVYLVRRAYKKQEANKE